MVAEKYKGQSIFIYLPSKADLKRHQDLAKEMSLPLSKLVVSVMEDFIEARHKDSPQLKTARENDRHREENAKITNELRIKSPAIDKWESDIVSLRQEIESKESSRRIDLDIVKLFMTRRAILKDKDVLTGLNFDELNLPQSSYRDYRDFKDHSFTTEVHGKIYGLQIKSQKIVYDALCNHPAQIREAIAWSILTTKSKLLCVGG